MRQIQLFIVVAVGVVLVFSSAQAFAVMWEGEAADIGSPERIADKATVILRGVVQSIEYSYLTNDSGKEIPYSTVTIKVIKGYRGVSDGDSFSFPMAGGEFRDGKHMLLGGQAAFAPTDHVIVNYNGEMYGIFATVGGDSGVLRVVSEGDEEIVLDHAWRPLMSFSGERTIKARNLRCIPMV
ncbi:MAG: hypothetical protein M5R36_08705 [Deltaproteobacteria bacterium]|nr:hypothetical protein [Deltaproteobacteria bacterium]